MSQSKIILVTGSNTGMGFELVRLLAQKGHIVYISARNPVSGEAALDTLHTDGLTTVKLVQLDVTDAASITTAAKTIEAAEGKLDVLVNNAGIANIDVSQKPSTVGLPILQEIMQTNFYGLVQTTAAFIPLLRKSSLPVILSVSSELGSNAYAFPFSPGPRVKYSAYAASKAAGNSYTVALAEELRGEGIRVNTVTPGMVSSKLTNFAPGVRSPEEAARSLMRFVLLDDSKEEGPTGKFFDWEGKEFPW